MSRLPSYRRVLPTLMAVTAVAMILAGSAVVLTEVGAAFPVVTAGAA